MLVLMPDWLNGMCRSKPEVKAEKQVNYTLKQSTGESGQGPNSSATEAKIEKCVISLEQSFMMHFK